MITFERVWSIIFWTGFIGVVAFCFYVQFKELLRQWRAIDAKYKADMAAIDADHQKRKEEIEENYQFEIRKLYEQAETPEICASFEPGDWVSFVPLERPVRSRCGQVVALDQTKCCVCIQHRVGEEIEARWYHCTEGAAMKKINALDAFTRELV